MRSTEHHIPSCLSFNDLWFCISSGNLANINEDDSFFESLFDFYSPESVKAASIPERLLLTCKGSASSAFSGIRPSPQVIMHVAVSDLSGEPSSGLYNGD